MLWDENVGQWKFEVSPPTREVRETVKDKDGFGREVVFDVCDGGRPRVAWDDFMSAREYLLALQRKIAKLKTRARERNSVRMPTSGVMFGQLDPNPAIKKEEDMESNISGSVGDGDVTMLTAAQEVSDKSQRHDVMTDHGQECSAALLNMMMSINTTSSPSARHLISITRPDPTAQENAMDLDLGPRSERGSHSASLRRNNGFGEINSGSPSLSPTASHASTAGISFSVEQDYDSPGE